MPMNPTFLFQAIPIIEVGIEPMGHTDTVTQHPLLQVPHVPSLDLRECKLLSKEFVNCDTTLKMPSATSSAIFSCW